MSLMIKVLDQWQELERLRGVEVRALAAEAKYSSLANGLRALVGELPPHQFAATLANQAMHLQEIRRRLVVSGKSCSRWEASMPVTPEDLRWKATHVPSPIVAQMLIEAAGCIDQLRSENAALVEGPLVTPEDEAVAMRVWEQSQARVKVVEAARALNLHNVTKAQLTAGQHNDPLYRDYMGLDARKLDEAFQAYAEAGQPKT